MPGYARPTQTISSQEISVAPVGGISSTSLQQALQELDAEKISLTDVNGTVTTQKNVFNQWDNTSGVNVANAGVGGTLSIPSIYSPGMVVQCKAVRVDTALTYACSGTGSEFTDLRVSITPKFANSLIVCQFQIHGEGASGHDWIARVWKNGSVPTGTYAGYNTVQGNQVWSGISTLVPYETDYASTPFTQIFNFIDYPGVTTPLTYAPGGNNSNGSAWTYYVNRTAGSTGAGGNEVGVSFSIAWEIAQ